MATLMTKYPVQVILALGALFSAIMLSAIGYNRWGWFGGSKKWRADNPDQSGGRYGGGDNISERTAGGSIPMDTKCPDWSNVEKVHKSGETPPINIKFVLDGGNINFPKCVFYFGVKYFFTSSYVSEGNSYGMYEKAEEVGSDLGDLIILGFENTGGGMGDLLIMGFENPDPNRKCPSSFNYPKGSNKRYDLDAFLTNTAGKNTICYYTRKHTNPSGGINPPIIKKCDSSLYFPKGTNKKYDLDSFLTNTFGKNTICYFTRKHGSPAGQGG